MDRFWSQSRVSSIQRLAENLIIPSGRILASRASEKGCRNGGDDFQRLRLHSQSPGTVAGEYQARRGGIKSF
jgi:hypothetical protein